MLILPSHTHYLKSFAMLPPQAPQFASISNHAYSFAFVPSRAFLKFIEKLRLWRKMAAKRVPVYGRRIGRGSISFSCPTTAVRSTGKRGSGVPFVHHDRLLSKLASHAFRYPPGHLGRSEAHSIALDEAHPEKLVSWRYVLSLPRYSTCKFC